MPRKELIGVWTKIERAKEHSSNLESEIGSFEARDPYMISRETDSQSNEYIFRVHIAEEIPRRWGTVLGDAIHNLRSSLDLLTNELVQNNGVPPSERTGFPIGNNRDGFERQLRQVAKGISRRAGEIMHRIEPYKGGKGDLLWRLHRLDIADKHRLLIPVGAAYRGVLVETTVYGEIFDEPFRLDPHAVDTGPIFPLEDGSVLMRFPFVIPDNAYLDTYFKPDFYIAFAEKQIFDGDPVMPTLQKLVDLTEGVVKGFESEIFS